MLPRSAWKENASNEEFEDDEKCLNYFHRFRTIKLLQDVLENIGKRAFISAFIEFGSIKNCGYTYADVVSTCTDHLIDRREHLKSRGLGVDNHGGFAFEDKAQGVACTMMFHQLISTLLNSRSLVQLKTISSTMHWQDQFKSPISNFVSYILMNGHIGQVYQALHE